MPNLLSLNENECERELAKHGFHTEDDIEDQDDPMVFCIRESDVLTWIKRDPNTSTPHQLALLPSAFKEAIFVWATEEFAMFMNLVLETVSEEHQEEYYPNCCLPIPTAVGLFAQE